MFEKFEPTSPLMQTFIATYGPYFKAASYPAKTIVLEEGQVATRVFWIKKGCMRVWLNREGQDVTFQFFLENSLVSSIESFWKGQPSTFTLETIEPTEVWVADKEDIQPLLDSSLNHPEYRDLFIDVIFQRTFDYVNHSLSFIQLTPEQRYLKLFETRPELIKRIPQHYIASYLGISKVHLSRIKNKLFRS
ncbi:MULTISPECIES: Crp/Fnr family transcriptional regulator [unclassified Myroides]|uniref:Crp/Fnr family transcriptional regulator n=1 Tax=unclassified Myroides TaxID=2642485 RepID=UPI0015FAA700|nr:MULTISPECIES: Crp/Fnr family transcriptional regulator [unclassified Myroides]MBB1150456.1 Crp/Fnr family transcriptional regulator [Myroides sp. NP-2]MDM1407421.1 Crp/Fnr family transcriptional regulator [Myroides sp. DF42-4-2]